jgi:hypothetical protein
LILRAPAIAAGRAVIIGTNKGDITQGGGKGLGPLVNIVGVLTTKNAGESFPCII